VKVVPSVVVVAASRAKCMDSPHEISEGAVRTKDPAKSSFAHA